MAKQRGIHQISGKINNLCYYEQKYVRGGLIRRINDAMSQRLKTDPVFANTRRANTIFGGCSLVASSLLEFFGSRNTYMFKPYRQALLTKLVQTYLVNKEDTSSYPTILNADQGFKHLPHIIDSIVKNKIRDSFPELPVSLDNLSLGGTEELFFSGQSLINFCTKYKCQGVQVTITPVKYIYAANFNTTEDRYISGESNPGGRVSFLTFTNDGTIEDTTFRLGIDNIEAATTFWIVYATPIIRFVNGRPISGETGASMGVITFRAQ